jgi:hypothetical protein
MARARDNVQYRETIIVIAERYQSLAKHREALAGSASVTRR